MELLIFLSITSRVSPQTLRAKELGNAGWIGKPYGMTFIQVENQERLTRPDDQKSHHAFPKQAGGGYLIWLGINDLDRVLFVTNEHVQQVTGFAKNVGGQPVGIEDAEAVAFQFRDGTVGKFHGAYSLEGDSYQAATTLWESQGRINMPGYRGPDESRRPFQWYSTHPESPRSIQTEREPNHVNSNHLLVQAAIDAACGSRPPPLTGAECLYVFEVIFGAYRASEIGTSQTVPAEIRKTQPASSNRPPKSKDR